MPGCREVVENGSNGLLSRVKDYLDLAEKMEIMVNLSYQDRSAMGSNGRVKMEKEFNVEIVNDLFINAVGE